MALDELLDEHEQGERVQKWLRDNALGLIGGLALGIAIIGGWKWWEQHSHNQRLQAGDAYQTVVASIAAGDLKKAEAAATGLGEGAYAELIALDLAKAHVDAGEHDAAIAALKRAQGGDPGLQSVVQQRLARLLIDTGKGTEALQLLASSDDAVSLETRGDAQFALGKTEEARQAYTDALRKLDVAAPQRRLLELKLTETGGTPEQPESQS